MPSKQGRKMTKSGVGAGSAGKTGDTGNLNDGGIGSPDPAGSGKLSSAGYRPTRRKFASAT